MTTRTNTARGASGGPMKPTGPTPPSSAAPVKKESTPYKPLPIPPTFDLELDSTQLKEAIAKLGYDPNGKIPTSLLVRPKANSSIPGRYWIKCIYIRHHSGTGIKKAKAKPTEYLLQIPVRSTLPFVLLQIKG